jgi:hypothetical protein
MPVAEQRGRASERPLARLVRHCVDRILHGGDTSEPGELDFGIGTMLALLATPGAFAAIFLADKYGTLFRFLRGEGKLDPFAASLPDEYFFVVLAMVVTGAVAIWKWDALIPDRRDYANLAPLPIPAGHIFLANAAALLSLATVLALDVNAASSILLPLIVCGSESSVRYVAVFFGTHLLSVVLASAFSFFAVLGILGLLMALLPYPLFRRCSVYVRCSLMIFLMAMLSTSFVMVDFVQHLSASSFPLVQLLAPVWFLGLCQHLRGISDPAFSSLARLAIPALPFSVILALGAYALSYRRCFAQSTEIVTNFGVTHTRRHGYPWLAALFLKTPFERGCFRFALKTLLRSENHTLIVGGFTGVGLVLASQTLFEAVRNNEVNRLPSPDLLSIPLMVSYFLLLGLRFSFEIPVLLRANWIFRMTVNPGTNECVPLARKVMLAFLIPLLVAGCFPSYALRWGWRIGLTHTTTVAVLCLLLIEVLLVRFRKVPFTCSMPSFKSNALVSVLFYFLGFVAFTSWASTAERWALADPLWYFAFIPLLAAVWLFLERYRGEMTYLDRQLIFEERPEAAVEVLDLTFSR